MKRSKWCYDVENAPRNDFFLILFPDRTWEKAKFHYDGDDCPYEGTWTINGNTVFPIAYQEIIIREEDDKVLEEYNKGIS